MTSPKLRTTREERAAAIKVVPSHGERCARDINDLLIALIAEKRAHADLRAQVFAALHLSRADELRAEADALEKAP